LRKDRLRDPVLLVNPATQVDQPALLRAEGEGHAAPLQLRDLLLGALVVDLDPERPPADRAADPLAHARGAPSLRPRRPRTGSTPPRPRTRPSSRRSTTTSPTTTTCRPRTTRRSSSRPASRRRPTTSRTSRAPGSPCCGNR